MTITFPKLEIWQQELYDDASGQLNSGKRFIVKSGRQRGKTFVIKILLIEYALKYPRTESCVIEPVSSQCRRVFSEIVDAIEPTGLLRSSNASDMIIRFTNGSQISFKSGESRKAIRGLTCSGLCVIDEAAFIEDEIIEIALPIINVHKCPVVAISTPMFEDSWFFRQYMSCNSNIKTFDWSLDKYDMSKYLSKELLEEYRAEYTPMKFKTEILGDFITEMSFIFGNFRECVVEPIINVPVYAGIDWGSGSNGDSTVVTFFNELKEVVSIWSTNTLSPNEQMDKIAEMINDTPTLKKVLVESNSIGEVYFSGIQSKLNNRNVIEKFYTSNESKREIIEDLILAFQKHEIGILDDSTLIKQLSYYEMQKTKTGYTYNNDNPNHHDDYVISLALGYHCFKSKFAKVSFGFSKRRR